MTLEQMKQALSDQGWHFNPRKGTVDLILNDNPFIKGHFLYITVPLKPLRD